MSEFEDFVRLSFDGGRIGEMPDGPPALPITMNNLPCGSSTPFFSVTKMRVFMARPQLRNLRPL